MKNTIQPAFLSGGAGAQTPGYRKTVKDFVQAIERLPIAELETFGPSSDPDKVIELYLGSLELGLGEPQLPLLNQGSQVFRAVVPRNAAQQRRVLSYYRKAMPYKFHAVNDLGVAVFRPGIANLPIVLRRSSQGDWYVDEQKSWSYFHRFETENNVFPKYSDLSLLPFLITMGQPNAVKPLYRDRVRTPKPASYPYPLVPTVRDLERKIQSDSKNPIWFAQLGELYLFEINWVTKALEMFEQAAALAPQKLDYRWRLWDLNLNNSEMEKALAELNLLSQAVPGDREVKEWNAYYSKAYAFETGDF